MFFRNAAAELSDHAWEQALDAFPVLAELGPDERIRLRRLANRFLQLKSIEPVQGLEMDEASCAAIAALACLPALELGLGSYAGWTSLIVYPGGFVARGRDVDEAGVVHEFAEPRSGEAWLRGPVILSWEDVVDSAPLDGYNVVIHEMAHKLDMLDGSANGFPPLHPDMDAVHWNRVFTAAFEDLNTRVDAARHTGLDPYAGQSPGEFFAVVSECFFELPRVLARTYPDVYRQLVSYYRQDPARRTRAR